MTDNEVVAENEPPGLQPERTLLAWRRTALSALSVSVISGREIVLHPSVLSVAVFVTLLTTAVGITVGTRVGHRRFILNPRDSREMPLAIMATLAAGIAIAGLGSSLVIQL